MLQELAELEELELTEAAAKVPPVLATTVSTTSSVEIGASTGTIFNLPLPPTGPLTVRYFVQNSTLNLILFDT